MGSVYRGIPPELATKLMVAHGLKTFVETGTYIGRTSAWASEKFDLVFTIESDYNLYRKAMSVLLNFPNVRTFHGFSQDLLPCVLGMFTGPALIWLDAHWSKDLGYAKFTEVMCPVMKEIEAIAGSKESHIVLIDDKRLFGKSAGFPKLEEIEESLGKTGRAVYYETDVIVAVPSWLKM